MSLFRRAGAKIAKFFKSAADPAAVADQVQLYSKDAAGITQVFARASDGTINQLTPATTSTPATSARALDTTFTPSATRYVMVSYTVLMFLAALDDSTVELRSDAASPPTTVRCLMRSQAGAVGLGGQRATGALIYIVPPGHNVRLVLSGTGTVSIAAQTEMTLG